jgi:uncharacterized protein
LNTYVIMLDKVPGFEISQETIRRHIDHLKELHRRSHLVLCGPFTDFPSGMVIVRAPSKDEAVKIAESDPFVIEGARTFSVRTWLLADEDNNYLG